MRRMKLLLFSIILLCLSTPAHAQLWSGIIDPSRAVDWSQAGVTGGIPNRTTICATLSPGVSAAQINSAIASCPDNQVVFLNAGTYNLSSGINFPKGNVTLRGAGADQTKLIFTGTSSCFLFPPASVTMCSGEQNDGTAPRRTATWTAGYAKGTTVIALGNTTGLIVGNHLVLDQLDDPADGWPAAGYIDICATGAPCTLEGGSLYARSGRVQTQVVTVTAINGLNVTISPGVALPNFRASQSPGAWWGNTTLKNAGLENMSLDYSATGSPGISIQNALNSWVKGVRGIMTTAPSGGLFNHVRLFVSGHLTIRDSYFYGPGTTAIMTYGIMPALTSDLLIENNILQFIPSSYVQNDPDVGSVVAYNYVTNTPFAPAFTLHGAGAAMVLFEGNNGSGFNGDIIHGTHYFITQYRNHFDGQLPLNGDSNAASRAQAKNRFFNIIGNVLGASRFTNYESDLINDFNSIFVLGDDRGQSIVPTDPRVQATLMRWGNYDTVTGAVRWNAAEVPSGLANFANPVPASQALPPSFYLSAKPSWWGTMPWPPIGPNVTGGDIAGYAGHAYKIPARLCYENTPKDANGILLFNAAACYKGSAGSAPSAPTGLRVQ